MTISLNTSPFPFTVTLQRRIWMHYIYAISELSQNTDNYKEKLKMISKIQNQLNKTAERRIATLLSIDLNKIELGILKNASQGIFISKEEKYSKPWDDSRELIISSYNQIKEV